MSVEERISRPYMRPDEVDSVVKMLFDLRPSRVLEWGSGGSTILFPLCHFIDLWVAVESDPKWGALVLRGLEGNESLSRKVRLLLTQNTEEYVQGPHRVWGEFDLIVVDGRCRLKCLEAARSFLNPNGYVLLHDASRAALASGIALYGNKTLLSEGDGRHQGLVLMRP